ncbi:hypothetical protein [Cribrihabitans pelagius]|uniref:hypothetical protein n=1 Tax=Cribrihabitans pelagius TaxID=1765746 RepID=UPI003B5A26C3
MFALQDFETATPVQRDDLQQSGWATACASGRMDSEMEIQLRLNLHGDFTGAQDWFTLCRSLRRKGFYLKRHGGGQLRLHDARSHVEICPCRALGHPTAELEARFGPAAPQQ